MFFLPEIILLVLVALVWNKTSSNRLRIEALEQEVLLHKRSHAKLKAENSPIAADANQESSPAPKPAETEEWRETSPNLWADASSESQVFTWLRENWLLAIGAMFMLFAAGWLARYSILNNLIGPVGRIASGLVLGTAVLGFAERRIRTHLNQGGLFAVLGSAIVLLTLFAGRTYYDMFTPATAMGLMLMTVSFVAFVSIRYNTPRLSYAGLIMAGLIPLFVSTGSKNFIGLFSYLAVVTAGTLWVVFLTNWRKNIPIALGIVSLYSVPVTIDHHLWHETPWVMLAFAFGFAVTFFFSSFQANLREKGRGEPSDLICAGLLVVYLMGWVLNVAPSEWQSLIFGGWALLFCVASYQLTVFTREPSFFYVYGGAALALLVAATATLLSGPTLTLALIAEAGVVPLIAWKAMNKERFAIQASFLMALPAGLSVTSLGEWAWRTDFSSHFLVTLAMTLVPMGMTLFLRHLQERSQDDLQPDGSRSAIITQVVMSTFFGGFFIWRTLHGVIYAPNVATILSLVIFMLVGIGAYVTGYLSARKPVKVYGGIIIAWVSLRLLFIDMPDMEAGGRVVTFFVLGTLLLGTAFFEHKGRKIAR